MKIKDLWKKPAKAEKEEKKEAAELQSVQFEIDAEKKKELVDLIIQKVEDYKDSSSAYMAARSTYIRQYEGKKEPKSLPWAGCSNLSTMVTTVAVDILHSKLFSMAWNTKTLMWEAGEEHDVEIADLNTKLMSWVVGTDMNMQDGVDDLCKCLLVDGTIAVKKIWKPYWTYVTRRTPKDVTAENILTGKLRYETSYDYIRRERCFLERRPLERVFFPYDADSTEFRWEDKVDIIDERWYTLAELREMQLDGVISDKVSIDELMANMQDIELYTDTEKARMDAEGTIPVNTIKESDKVKCYEAEIMYDINNDGRRERIVVFIAAEPGFYLGGKPMHAVSHIGRSSWLIRPFLRRPGRPYGKSIPELVYHHQNEMDAIHNQRIDAGNMAIAPFFFYRSPANVNPRRIIVGPATGVPVDNPDQDIRFPTFPTNGLQVSFQEEKLVWDMIERLTYLTPAMLGQETADRPTARGTLAVINQGEQKFALLGLRVQNIFCALLTDIRQMYEERMPPETWSRVMGRENVRGIPSPEAIAGQYEARMQLDLTAGDPTEDRQMAVTFFQTMAMDPLVMQNPVFMWEVRADYARALKRLPVEKYIGPRPPSGSDWKDVEDIVALIEQEMTNIDLNNLDPNVIPKLLEFEGTKRYQAMTINAKRIFKSVIRELKRILAEKIQQGVMLNAGQQTQPGAGSPGGAPPGIGGFSTMGSGGPNMPGQGAPATGGSPVGPGQSGGAPQGSA